VIDRHTILYFWLFIFLVSCNVNQKKTSETINSELTAVSIEENIEALLLQMTLEEKIGQMNQYNGFWDVTGPVPENGQASIKYENLRKGYVGSMLNVNGVEAVRTVQKIAVEESRLWT